MGITQIAWSDYSYNAHIGCTKIGVGCEGCYAESWAKRFESENRWGPGAPRRQTRMSTRLEPYKWNKKAAAAATPMKVFAHSLSDVFDNEVPDQWRADEFHIWRSTPWLRWIVLTKRPGNIAKMLPNNWSRQRYSNVGFCCSVATQEEFDREVPKLVNAVDAAWLGVSIEPQVEHIKIPYLCNRSIQWIITGGASAQPGYDPPAYNADWARSLISQCAHAGIACFVKQFGSNAWDGGQKLSLQHKKGEDPEEWPADICVREFPEQLMT